MVVGNIVQKVTNDEIYKVDAPFFHDLGRFCVLQPDLMNKKKFQFNPNAFQTLKVLLQW